MNKNNFNAMAQPTTLPVTIDWTLIIGIWTFVLSGFGVVLYWIRQNFIYKQTKDSEFIQKLVITTVTATMEGCLKGIQGDVYAIKESVNQLFKYREDDRQHYDSKFDRMTDNKK